RAKSDFIGNGRIRDWSKQFLPPQINKAEASPTAERQAICFWMKRQRVYLREICDRRSHILAIEDLRLAITRDDAKPAPIPPELQSSARVAHGSSAHPRGRFMRSRLKQE